MRHLLLAAALLLSACDDFAQVQKEDSIEAWEQWLSQNPDAGSKTATAKLRLEELYVEKARLRGTLEDRDAYLLRYPKGKYRDEIKKAREDALFQEAEDAGTVDGWKHFLSLCPDAGRRLDLARAGLKAAEYAPNLKIGEVRVEPVNLAEDPKGPKDGVGFFADVTNAGPSTLTLLWFNLHLLDANGLVVGRKDGPLVAPQAASRLPIAEKDRVPMKPGETRTFTFTTGALPEGFANKVKLIPARLGTE